MRKYLGIPYKDHGRTLEGLDCWGLCVMLADNEYGYQLPMLSKEYSSASDGKSVEHLVNVSKLSQWEKVNVYERGDIVLFNIMGLASHVGTYVGDGNFIHILAGSQVTIEKLDSIVWSRRLEGVYRRCEK